MRRCWLRSFAWALLAFLPVVCRAQGALLAERGQSAYRIYHATNALASVRLAAVELQRVIERSTGVTVPIVQTPQSPMIALGDTEASRAAGIDAAQIPDEGFRILSRGGDVFIVGRDWGDRDRKWDRCDSTGTLFGVYDFLERVVGVRWLMPGPLGEDVPDHRDRLEIPPLDLADAPVVRARMFEVGRRADPDVQAWLRRRRLGRSIAPAWGHNFAEFPPTAVLLAHPEYMPLQADGAREKPMGDRSWGSYEHRFCMSNPGLIQAFGESLNTWFDQHPRAHGQSMAPSDGGRWCVCTNCQALTMKGPSPEWGTFAPYGHSSTPLVLNFYNGVARAVAAKHPDRLVGGLLYQDYLYPPPGDVRVESNVFMALAINAGYGFKFYKPETAALIAKLIARWSAVAPSLGWSDYSTWMRDPFGAPLPPGLPILKTVFPAFGRSLKVINYCGQEAWGYGGAHNYVVTSLMWNNQRDIDALYAEYLDRAYGPAASQMKQMYELVEQSLRRYIVAKPYPDHEIWYDTARDVYVPIFADLERLYLEADRQALSDVQRQRLGMLGDNLVVLHWNLRHAGQLKLDLTRSAFYCADEAFQRFMQAREGSLALVDLAPYRRFRWQSVLWAPESRELAIPLLPDDTPSPQLDGQLTDAAWSSAAVADQFRSNAGERGAAYNPTVARLVCDGTNLYAAFECAVREPAKIRAECRVPNSDSIFADDVVELLCRPKGAPDVRLAANAAGTVHGPAGLRAAAAVGPAGWTVELSVPLASLKAAPPAAGVVWRGNLARRKAGQPIEQSAWCRVEDRLEDARAYGEWVFTVPAPPVP